MHHSRLHSIVIDCNDLDAAARFWAHALGTEVAEDEQPPYAVLKASPGGVRIVLQAVPEPKTAKSRMHLDIATDNVEAEVRRLEGLGAVRKEQVQDWWVLLDPSGNEFCVVPAAIDEFAVDAQAWA